MGFLGFGAKEFYLWVISLGQVIDGSEPQSCGTGRGAYGRLWGFSCHGGKEGACVLVSHLAWP